MRLNWFLPFLRKRSQPASKRSPSWVRRALKRMGPSVVASPLRRLIQGLCLLLFLVLFYYVCWPYSARPDPPGKQSSGWTLADIEQETGALFFAHRQPPAWTSEESRTIHVVDASTANMTDAYVGAFQLSADRPARSRCRRWETVRKSNLIGS